MSTADHDQLLQLNIDYVNAVQHSDVERFEQILAEDFRCSNPDGTLLERSEFLEQTARPVSVTGLRPEDVEIRIFNDCAVIHARTAYKDAQGQDRMGRYTDVWIKRGGEWRAISAHVTRG